MVNRITGWIDYFVMLLGTGLALAIEMIPIAMIIISPMYLILRGYKYWQDIRLNNIKLAKESKK